MKELDLSYNKLSDLDNLVVNNDMEFFPLLHTLILSNNKSLLNIPTWIKYINNLQIFDVSYCNIANID